MAGLVRERIDRLLSLAREAAGAGDLDRSRRYVRRAREIGERYREPLGRRFTRLTCDACDRYLYGTDPARVRLQDGHVVVTCSCGARHRYPYRPMANS